MSEISPELAARIESLRASHAENPARFFMPLASAYREGGEVAKAEELLRENLKRHPGYLSAHVLLGRCLADRGATAEARNEFQYVLSVDPQNLIALRTLGEMAAAAGEADEARRWFGELLSVDPMNAEARQSLAALDAPPPVGSEADGFGMVDPGAAAAPVDDHPAAHADPGSWGEVSLDEPPAVPAAAPAAEPAPATFEALDFGAVDLSAETPAEAPVSSAEAAPDASADTSSEPSAPEPAAAQDAGGAGGFDAWGSVDDGQDQVDAGAVEHLALEEFYDGSAAPAAAEEHDEHGEVVTETIAELYARQGFPERAAGVYRELIARRGEEPALVRRLQELEEQARAAAAGAEGERFEPIDLPGEAAADEIAAAQAGEPPSWLSTVDAVVAGDVPSGEAQDEGGLVDFQPDEPIAAVEEPAAEAAPALTGDAFADSFANGFAGFASAPERREWEAPRVEETSPAEEPAAAEVFAEAEETFAAAEVPAPPQGRGESIVSYLSAILAWRPGALRPEHAEETRDAEGAAPPAEPADAAGPPPARPWDEETLGASDQQPPVDEPWLAGADTPSAETPSAEASPAEPTAADASAADEPWAAPAEAEPWAETPQAEPEPWAAAEEQGEELPWLTQDAGAAEPSAPAPPADPAPMPWETSFELSPEVPEGTQGERAGPREEPTAEPGGGFSFEDFFSEPVAPAQPEPQPEPAPLPEPIAPPAAAQAQPTPAAEPQAAEASEEDEDLESFQAWLQSLKR